MPENPKLVGRALALLVVAALAFAAMSVAGASGASAGPNCPNPNVVRGTAGDDVLNGTPGNDLLLGGRGDDTMNGLGGDDCVFGGRGEDTVQGGEGNDRVRGGPGDDVTDGGTLGCCQTGDDEVYGGPGADTVFASDFGLQLLYGGPGRGVNWPYFLAVLRAPVGTAAPAISGGAGLGQPLSCSRGAWAGDLAGASLFRAPQSFAYQWIRGGSDIGGATLRTFTPTTPGSYACRVTAINRAGGTSHTSAVLVV